MAKRYLVLGTGIAGLSAAREIRGQDPEAEVFLIGAEPDSPYLRPLLSKTECFGIVGMASVNMKDGLVKLLKRENLERGISVRVDENRISLMKGCAVAAIDPKQHLVSLSDGRKLSYDKCIYALGADCYVPPIPGRDKEGGTGPRHFARLNNEVGIVDIEVELVVVSFGRHLVVEADAVGRGEGNGDADFGRLAVGEAGGGTQAERAGIGTGVGDCPRIGALCPAGGMVDTTLEGFKGIGTYIDWVDCVNV